jgi:hypothetical protein
MKTILSSNNQMTMKTAFLFSIALFFIFLMNNKTNAQTYREQFDKLDHQIYTDAFLNSSNFSEILHNVTQSLMRSYVLMYKKTSDLKYLEKFIITSKRVMDRRDDNFNNVKNYMNLPVTFGPCTIGANTTQIDPASKGWSRINTSNCVLEVAFMETGTITYPMAEFILLIQEHPELDNEPLPTEALSTTSGINTYGGATILTFKQYANWLRDKVYESLDWQMNKSYYPATEYFSDAGPPGTGSEGINQQAAIGRTLLLMHRVSVNDGQERLIYMQIAQRLATHVYDVLHDGAIGGLPALANGAPWYAWCHIQGCESNYWEDITHSWLEIEMIKEMVDEGIPASNAIYFSTTDMQKFANGFLYRMCATPKTATMNVYGHSLPGSCFGACDGTPDDDYYQAGGLVFLSEYNQGVYQAVSDIYSPNQMIDGTINSVFGPNGINGKAMLGLSQLVYYETYLNPITVKPNSSTSSSYTGAASGDFDNDGQFEFASLNTSAGNNTLQAYTINSTNNIINSAYNLNMTGTFKYLASGDIVTSNPGDELVSIDIQNNLIVVFKQQGNSFIPVTQIGIPSDNYTGIAMGEFSTLYSGKEIIINSSVGGSETFKIYGYDATSNTLINIPVNNNIGGVISRFITGDFNGDGTVEIAVIDNSHQLISTYSLIAGNLFQLNATSGIISLNNADVGITSGDFDGDGIDEIILYKKLNALDGSFQIYKQNGTTIAFKGEEIFQLNQENGVMCNARLKNYPTSDALVTFRNYDGQISIFNMSNLCPGLHLNNETLDNSSTINNNYAIDYHVSNTLIAGNNFTVASGSKVTFTAGKEIILLPGFHAEAGSDFHAYIDPTLECNPSVFRKANTNNNSTQNHTSNEKIKTTDNNNIGIAPNPNNGSFQISITKNNQPIAVKNIEVCDVLGKIIFSIQPSSNNVFIVDISSYSQGIYFVRSINVDGDIDIKKLVKQ